MTDEDRREVDLMKDSINILGAVRTVHLIRIFGYERLRWHLEHDRKNGSYKGWD